ncbi:hypothetical protein IFM89_015274 [Coptis chinensis]|uniref:Uncharacterized protein n=1 Tax=Coptis chinensis TaxID=261450 RepID=A0A835LIQ7_9MAGN|nr:hypothetical protein IFM89_015274 [Coptis chinensis]
MYGVLELNLTQSKEKEVSNKTLGFGFLKPEKEIAPSAMAMLNDIAKVHGSIPYLWWKRSKCGGVSERSEHNALKQM